MRARSPEFPILDVMIALRVRRRWPVVRGKKTGWLSTLAPAEAGSVPVLFLPKLASAAQRYGPELVGPPIRRAGN